MRKNNFDLIKSKFDNCELEVPLSLDSRVIEEKIKNKEQHKRIKFKMKNNYAKRFAVIAACFILILGVAFTVNSGFFEQNKIDGGNEPNTTISNENNIDGYKSYDEINSKISTLNMQSPISEMGCGIFYSSINKTEENTQYADGIATDGEYIYYAYETYDTDDNFQVYIYKINNGNTEFVSVIGNLAEEIQDEYADSYDLNNILVKDNRLIILMKKYNMALADKYQRDLNETLIKIYDITDKSNPVILTEYIQSGEYFDGRIIDDTLYVTSNYKIVTTDEEYTIPKIQNGEKSSYVSPENIISFDNVTDAQYAVISTIDVKTGSQSKDLRAVLGGSPKIHNTQEYIYISNYSESEIFGEPNTNITSAMKLNLKNGKISYATKEEIDQYLCDVVDIGKSSYYQSRLYPVGNYYINVGYDNETFVSDIILFDKDMNVVDSITLDKNIDVVMASTNFLAMNEEQDIFAIPVYFKDTQQDSPYSSFGCVVFTVENNKIVIKDNVKSDGYADGYYGRCRSVISGDYIYCLDVNDNVSSDKDRLKFVSYKF